MKTKIFITLIAVGLSIFILTSCNNSDNNKTSEKELELQKRELDLRQKELDLKEKELAEQNNNSQTKTNKSTSSNSSTDKTTTTTEKPSNNGYNFAEHSNFKTFWTDFKKAVNAGEKETVAKMTNIPFQDKFQEVYYKAYGGEKPLTANSSSDFISKYDKIFIPQVVKAINTNKYRGWSKEAAEDEFGPGQDVIEKGEYLLEVSSDGLERMYNLAFSKKGGVYKLSYMPYYE